MDYEIIEIEKVCGCKVGLIKMLVVIELLLGII